MPLPVQIAEITTFTDASYVCELAHRSFMLSHDVCAVTVATGLEGTLLVLAFGQILPQLVGSRYPTNHFSLWGCEQLVYTSLFLEKTGIVHLSWAAAAGVRNFCGLSPEPYGFGGKVRQKEAEEKSEARALMTDDAMSSASHTAEGEGTRSVMDGLCEASADCVGALRYAISVGILTISVYLSNNHMSYHDSLITTKELNGNGWVRYVLFIVLLLFMGLLEGLMLSVLALDAVGGAVSPSLHAMLRDGEVVRRFLCGRQLLVVALDFVFQRLTGLYGIPIVVIVAQVFPQLVASRNPGFWVGLPGARAVLYFALGLEATGATHFGRLAEALMVAAGKALGMLTPDPFGVGGR